MVRLILIGKRIYNKFSEDEMTVYAAPVSYTHLLRHVSTTIKNNKMPGNMYKMQYDKLCKR